MIKTPKPGSGFRDFIKCSDTLACCRPREACGAQAGRQDPGHAFVFGSSKLDIMLRGATPESVRMSYRDIAKPGVRVLRETITAIDPPVAQETSR
jgi:hypothetical protein